MKEHLSLKVAADTSKEGILALRAALKRFVAADENRTDFQSDFDIELISLNALTQLKLQVVIKHKVGLF